MLPIIQLLRVGGGEVAWYRLYFFDRKGHIGRALDIECQDDEEAISRMAEHKHGHAIELWQRERRIKRFEPDAPA